jgi:hypothetical protein
MPPDHAGVECDDGNGLARTGYSCWAAVYQYERDLASVFGFNQQIRISDLLAAH